jgi:RNA polymerase sigma-70 factor (ECF subfamily)
MPIPYRIAQQASDGVAVQTLAVRVEIADVAERARQDRSFEDLYGAAFPKIYAFIRCQVSTVETAEELVSRVFVKAYKHRQGLPTSGTGMMRWIFRVARTTLIDYWRVEKRRELVSLPLDEIAELTADSEDPEAAYARKQRSAHILQVMNSLSDDDQMLLTLKFVAQRTNREIAGILSLSEGAVSMRLLRALRRLRDQLRGMGWR